MPLVWGVGCLFGWIEDVAAAAEVAEAAGRDPSELQQSMQEAWGEVHGYFYPSPEQLAEEVALHRQGYLEGFGRRAINSFFALILLSF